MGRREGRDPVGLVRGAVLLTRLFQEHPERRVLVPEGEEVVRGLPVEPSVMVDGGDGLLHGEDGVPHVVPRPQEAPLFGSHGEEEHRAGHLESDHRLGGRQDLRDAEGVVVRSVVDAVAIGVRGPDADVIEVGGEDDHLVAQLGIRSPYEAPHVPSPGGAKLVDGLDGYRPQIDRLGAGLGTERPPLEQGPGSIGSEGRRGPEPGRRAVGEHAERAPRTKPSLPRLGVGPGIHDHHGLRPAAIRELDLRPGPDHHVQVLFSSFGDAGQDERDAPIQVHLRRQRAVHQPTAHVDSAARDRGSFTEPVRGERGLGVGDLPVTDAEAASPIPNDFQEVEGLQIRSAEGRLEADSPVLLLHVVAGHLIAHVVGITAAQTVVREELDVGPDQPRPDDLDGLRDVPGGCLPAARRQGPQHGQGCHQR